MNERKTPFASDLVATLKYDLAKEEGAVLLPGFKTGHAGIYFSKTGSLLCLDSYLSSEEIERDEDGDPIDLDEDGTHDPTRVYLCFRQVGKEPIQADFFYRDFPAIKAFLTEIKNK